jgi:DNA transposition AAA+ family ATPase
MSDVFDGELYRKFFDMVGSPEEGEGTSSRRISQAKAAQALGYSSGVISAYKGKTYNGDVKTLEKKIDAWLKREARRLDRLDVPVAETKTNEKMRRAITIAQDEADIAVIIGDAGTGKTTALRQYEKENHSALLVEVDPSFSQITLMKEIARAVGVDAKGGQNAIVERVIEALTGRDAVLIIDEADYLSDSALELIRRIINDKSKTGVVLVGLPRLEFKIRNLRNDHQQLQSRIGVLVKLGKLKKSDAEKIITGVWKDVPKDTMDAFIQTANGSTRTLVKLMGRVHQIMGLNRADAPDAEIIAEAGELLMR